MGRAGRVIEIVLGVFFVLSAASKTVDMTAFAVQVSLYGVVKEPSLVRAAAYGAVSIETLLGALFLGAWRLRGLTYAAGTALVVVFTGLIAYAWAFKGLEDCGCFGEYVEMGPGLSILKNLFLLAALGAAWYGTRAASTETSGTPWLRPGLALAGAAAVVVVFAINSPKASSTSDGTSPQQSVDPARPFTKYSFESDGKTYDLGKGLWLVAMLSATCDHCQASVDLILNDLTLLMEPNSRGFCGLMLGSESEIAEFRALTQPEFATFPLDALEFFQFVDSAPPQLILVRDGAEVTSWSWEENPPAIETVMEAVETAAAE